MNMRRPYLTVVALLLCLAMPYAAPAEEAARAAPACVVDVMGQPADMVNAPALDQHWYALTPDTLRAPMLWYVAMAPRTLDQRRTSYRYTTAGRTGNPYPRRWGSPLRTCTSTPTRA